MNFKAILIIIGVFLAVIPYFFISTPIYIVALMGAVFGIIASVIGKVMIRRRYPVSLRVYENRLGSPIITKDTRAYRITKNHKDFYRTVDGKTYNAPEHKYIIKGSSDNYVAIFDNQGMHLPVIPNREKFNEIEPVNEDQKNWLATQIEENIAVTTPEKSSLDKMIPIMLVAVTGIVLTIMLVSFMQHFPTFVAQTSAVMQAQIDSLDRTVDKFTSAVETYKAPAATVSNTGTPPH